MQSLKELSEDLLVLKAIYLFHFPSYANVSGINRPLITHNDNEVSRKPESL